MCQQTQFILRRDALSGSFSFQCSPQTTWPFAGIPQAVFKCALGKGGSPAHDLDGLRVAAEVVSWLLQAKCRETSSIQKKKKRVLVNVHRCLLQKKGGVDKP